MGDIFRHDVKIGDKIITNFDKNSKSYSTLEDFARSLFLNGHKSQATGLPVASGGLNFEIGSNYVVIGSFLCCWGAVSCGKNATAKTTFAKEFASVPAVCGNSSNQANSYQYNGGCTARTTTTATFRSCNTATTFFYIAVGVAK